MSEPTWWLSCACSSPGNGICVDGCRYATTFAGWFLAALSNSHLAHTFDLGILLALGAVLQVLAHALRVWLPPFALFTVTFLFASLGQAYQDTHANTFVSSVTAAHRWLGFIHAMYMAGCLVGPFVSTAVASADPQSRWNLFYTAPLGLGLVNLALVLVAFRDRLSWKKSEQGQPGGQSGTRQEAWKEMQATLRTPGVWLLSLFFFFFLGAVITAGGELSYSFQWTRNLRNLSQDGSWSTSFRLGMAIPVTWAMFLPDSTEAASWDDCSWLSRPIAGVNDAWYLCMQCSAWAYSSCSGCTYSPLSLRDKKNRLTSKGFQISSPRLWLSASWGSFRGLSLPL